MAHRPPQHKPFERCCPQHGAKSADRRRYMTARWRRLRKMVLRRWPFCSWPGCDAIATQVDHIVPIHAGGEDILENLQGLCARHHGMKTRSGQ